MEIKLLKKDHIDDTRLVFQTALKTLQTELDDNQEILHQFPQEIRRDLLSIQIMNDGPWRGGIYDINIQKREIRFSQELLENFYNYWEVHNFESEEKSTMCWLYFLHEFRHIKQKVDSDTYLYSKNSKTIFQKLDYIADAFAVKSCYLLKFTSQTRHWNKLLAEIIAIHIKGGEIFSSVDKSSNLKTITGERFHRQMIWHFQYARAVSFNPDVTLKDYNIEESVALEVFDITDRETKKNFCDEEKFSLNEIKKPLSVHILVGEERLRYVIEITDVVKSLLTGVFDGDLDGTVEGFRSFFSDHPYLTGRGGEKIRTNSNQVEISDTWQVLREELPVLYKTGPMNQSVWERAGGDISRLNISDTPRTQWFEALRLLKAGGGGGITVSSLIKVVYEDYSDNIKIKYILESEV